VVDYKNDPWRWPLNMVVQGYTGPYKPEDLRVYMLGNPFVWWLNLLVLVIFPGVLLHKLFTSQRRASKTCAAANVADELSAYLRSASWLYLGWCLHYLPFFLMGRALYIHHYYPALVFSTCLTGVLLDLGLDKLANTSAAAARMPLLIALAALLVFSFRLFSPLVYGFRGDAAHFENSSLHHLHWLDDWYF
jgi:dolichyl-phosphate-mannose-protein mannosyltransferase